MIKIAICDDEQKDRDRLQELLRNYMLKSGEKYDVKLFASGEEFLTSQFSPDILFLDIIMNDKDGIQAGAEIKRKFSGIIIIYITCLKEKMTAALNQIHSFGYLVKPINEHDFDLILSDAINEINQSPKSDTVIFLSDQHTLIELSARDIYFFEYFNRKIKIVTKDRTYICIKEKINNIADKMQKYGFAMSHQSFVVNLYHVDKISSQLLIMKNGEKVYLAQKRAAAFRKRLMQIAKESV